MPRNTSVSLGEHFTSFIDAQVGSGRYASASDVVRAGLRLLEAEEAKLERLRELIAEGDASGYIEDFDFDSFLAEMREEKRRRA